MDNIMNFSDLIVAISDAHGLFHTEASKAINIYTTIKNWLIGAYIQEYEQKGADRAQYGTELLSTLAKQLKKQNVSGCSARNLWIFRRFYQTYPVIWQTVSAKFKDITGVCKLPSILQTVSAEFGQHQLVTGLNVEILLRSLSFSHFVELIKFDESLKRSFYELECVKCGWTVRELRRQIGSLYYERMGLSKNKKKLVETVRAQISPEKPSDIIRDP